MALSVSPMLALDIQPMDFPSVRLAQVWDRLSNRLVRRPQAKARDIEMTRYFFDMREGDQIAVDEQGLELNDLEQVQEEAVVSLADMAKDVVGRKHGDPSQRLAIEVRDESGPVMQAQIKFEIGHLRKH